MIHIATVHWKSDKWIDIQLRYLRKNVPTPFRVYAFLNDVPNLSDHRQKFFYTSIEPIADHATKLNILADMIAFNAQSDDDLIIFLDGDAFPIADLGPLMSSAILKSRQLAAIQRKENLGDVAPHPSFCITTIGVWRRIKGDWKAGHRWKDANGDLVTDVGGNLLEILERHRIDWYPLLRSNGISTSPLLFGVYGDLIYHHGGGFRQGSHKICKHQAQVDARASLRGRLLGVLPDSKLGLRIKRRFHPVYAATERVRRENMLLNDTVFERIANDENFLRDALRPPSLRSRLG